MVFNADPHYHIFAKTTRTPTADGTHAHTGDITVKMEYLACYSWKNHKAPEGDDDEQLMWCTIRSGDTVPSYMRELDGGFREAVNGGDPGGGGSNALKEIKDFRVLVFDCCSVDGLPLHDASQFYYWSTHSNWDFQRPCNW